MNKFQMKREDEFVETGLQVSFGESAASNTYRLDKHTTNDGNENSNVATAGSTQELAYTIAEIYQRTVAPAGVVRLLSLAQRRTMRDQIVEAMSGQQRTPELMAIANLLAGLTDEPLDDCMTSRSSLPPPRKDDRKKWRHRLSTMRKEGSDWVASTGSYQRPTRPEVNWPTPFCRGVSVQRRPGYHKRPKEPRNK